MDLALTLLSLVMVVCGLLTFSILTLTPLKATYGRYAGESWLPAAFAFKVPARVAWFLQEVPSVAVSLVYIFQYGCEQADKLTNVLAIGFFLIHYAHRSFLYPWLIRGGKATPVDMFAAAVLFCSFNGYLQTASHCRLSVGSSSAILQIAGVCLYVLGFGINIHSDSILRNLRKPGEVGYRIPHGGLFEYVSSANYFGEMVEWVGLALFAATPAAAAFALFTVCNLLPRAISHHRWYLQKFDDYPKSRMAVVPYLL